MKIPAPAKNPGSDRLRQPCLKSPKIIFTNAKNIIAENRGKIFGKKIYEPIDDNFLWNLIAGSGSNCPTSPVSFLIFHVSCLMSPFSCFLSHFSCLMPSVLYHLSCLMFPVSLLLFPVSLLLGHFSCLTSPVSHLLSHIFCLTTFVWRLLSPVSCFMSPVLFLSQVMQSKKSDAWCGVKNMF